VGAFRGGDKMADITFDVSSVSTSNIEGLIEKGDKL
jgi:hypothetical protein